MLRYISRSWNGVFWLTCLVTLFALRGMLPWQSDLPSHHVPAQVSVSVEQASHDCVHDMALAVEPAQNDTGSCQIRCDLATAVAFAPVFDLQLPNLPETRVAIQPKLTLGIMTAPDHPPPIA